MSVRWMGSALLVLGLVFSSYGFAQNQAPTPGSSTPPWDLKQLMLGLAAHQPKQAQYVEEKYLGVLDTPLISYGELRYVAPDHLEKKTRAPNPATMTLSGDTLTLTEGHQTRTLDLSKHPGAALYADSIRGLLSGNLALLQKTFSVQLSGNRDHWRLLLRPIGHRVDGLLDSVSVTGSGYYLRRFEYDQADGDRSIMTIQLKAQP